MPLFRENPYRTAGGIVGALVVAHLLSGFLSSIYVFHYFQTSIAMLAIAALMLLVTMHHRQESHLLTETQEEMVLIAGFGLFWFAAILAWRAFTQSSGGGGSEGSGLGLGGGGDGFSGRLASGRMSRHEWPAPCKKTDRYCVVEEWSEGYGYDYDYGYY